MTPEVPTYEEQNTTEKTDTAGTTGTAETTYTAGTSNTTPTPNTDPSEQSAEKQCRICYDGDDPQLGRLIRPCLCRGSVSYVHTACLNRWRKSSTSQSAFYQCPQCKYHYRFARTKVVGMASNTVVVGALTAFAFTLLLFFSSFITTFLVSGSPSDGDSFFIIYPWQTFRDVVRIAVCFFTDTCDDFSYPFADFSFFRSSARGPIKPRVIKPRTPPTLFGRFIRRLLLGLPTVGAASVINLLWSLPLPSMQWFRLRMRQTSRRYSDFATLVLIGLVLLGAIRALIKVYNLTEKTVKRLLLRAEDAILEVP